MKIKYKKAPKDVDQRNHKCYYCNVVKPLKKLMIGCGTLSNPRMKVLLCKKHEWQGV